MTGTSARDNKSCVDILKLLVFCYLYIPVIIFCITWFKPLIAVIACIGAVVGTGLYLARSKTVLRKPVKREWVFAAASLIIILIWCALSGFGGYVLQSGDFPKHNVILRDIMVNKAPVTYDFDGREGTLSYYIAGYIVPALAGHFFSDSFDAAQDTLLIWNAVGIFLAVLLLYRNIGHKKGASLIIITLTLILFATFVCPLSGIFKNLYPDEAGDGIHWLSNVIWIQYSSDIMLLAYVFPQMISGLLGVSLLKETGNDYGKWGLILAPLVMYSAFVFLGMAILMLTVFVADLLSDEGERKGRAHVKETLKSVFSLCNLCSLVFAAVLILYLMGNILQEKPSGVAMGIERIYYGGYYHTLIFFELSWLLWILLLLKREKENRLLFAAAFNLLIYPFFKMGYYNDLCMRASIPALLVISVTVAENIIISVFGEDIEKGGNRQKSEDAEIGQNAENMQSAENTQNAENGKSAERIQDAENMRDEENAVSTENAEKPGKDLKKGRDLWYAALLTVCLLISAAGPLGEIRYYFTGRSKDTRNYFEPYASSSEFFLSHDFVEYQYIDWDPDSISKKILK